VSCDRKWYSYACFDVEDFFKNYFFEAFQTSCRSVGAAIQRFYREVNNVEEVCFHLVNVCVGLRIELVLSTPACKDSIKEHQLLGEILLYSSVSVSVINL